MESRRPHGVRGKTGAQAADGESEIENAMIQRNDQRERAGGGGRNIREDVFRPRFGCGQSRWRYAKMDKYVNRTEPVRVAGRVTGAMRWALSRRGI